MAIGIVVIVAVVIVGFLYTQFVQEKKISPEETRKMMQKAGGH